MKKPKKLRSWTRWTFVNRESGVPWCGVFKTKKEAINICDSVLEEVIKVRISEVE